jgi:hypothetical protein
MSSTAAITAQSPALSTPVRSLPTPRETSLNINNKNLNGRPGRNPVVSPQPVGHSQRSVLSTGPAMTVRSHQKIRVTVLCARSLAKRDLFRLPDPFVRVNVDGSGKLSRNLKVWAEIHQALLSHFSLLFLIGKVQVNESDRRVYCW